MGRRDFNHGIHHSDQIDINNWLAFLPRKGTQVLDDPPHTPTKLGYLIQIFRRTPIVASFKKKSAIFGEGADCHQWLVQLVAKPRRQFTQGRKFPRLNQIGLRAFQRGFGLFPFEHLVAQRSVGIRQGAGALAHTALQFGIGPFFGCKPQAQHAPPFHQDQKHRAKNQNHRPCKRRLQKRRAIGRSRIQKKLARHIHKRQVLGDMKRRARDIRPPVYAPDFMRTMAVL